jgi:hypothetical protein
LVADFLDRELKLSSPRRGQHVLLQTAEAAFLVLTNQCAKILARSTPITGGLPLDILLQRFRERYSAMSLACLHIGIVYDDKEKARGGCACKPSFGLRGAIHCEAEGAPCLEPDQSLHLTPAANSRTSSGFYHRAEPCAAQKQLLGATAGPAGPSRRSGLTKSLGSVADSRSQMPLLRHFKDPCSAEREGASPQRGRYLR